MLSVNGGILNRLKLFFKEKYSRLITLSDAPQKIAHGVALGTALDFLPIPVISIPVAYLLARLIRVNAFAAALSAMFFKWVVPLFYGLNYMMGSFLVGALPAASATPRPGEFSLAGLLHIGYPFLLGAVVNAALAWLLVYFPLRRLLENRRRAGERR